MEILIFHYHYPVKEKWNSMKTGIYYFVSIVLISTLLACSDKPSVENELAEESSPPPLISREILFGNPSRFQGRLSPDASKMSFRAPLDGVMNLWVGERGNFDSVKPITKDTGRGIPSHFWALDSQHVMYIQDKDGDENWHLYRIDLESGETIDLSPYDGVQANFLGQSDQHPGQVIVGMNDRDPKWHDVYRVNLSTGDRQLVEQNDGFGQFFIDNDLNVRLAMKTLPDGSTQILSKEGSQWKDWFTIPYEDVLTTSILGFDKSNEGIFMLDSRGRNTAALAYKKLGSSDSKMLASDERVDVSSVLFDPQTHEPFAYALNLVRPIWHATQAQFEPIIEKFNAQLKGGSSVLAQSLDNNYWTVYTDDSDQSPVYKVFDKTRGTFEELFTTQPEINDLPLSKMHGVTIRSRDNLDLVSYLSIPLASDPDQDGVPESTSPLIMLVHGGPWARDVFGYTPTVQWLTNRGYAVLQVNFRSSTGFGKAFINAGDKQWAAAMHDDIIDAKRWAVSKGITKDDQVAIMGGSYGGYATLVGLTFTPDEFSCGVDIVGPSNLVTLLDSIPPYWESFRQVLYNAVGDPTTEEGLAMLKERSPINYVDRIVKPLLIAQGANDPRVKQAESDQIVEAMKKRNIPVTYVLYPDEGHGFQKPENNLSFYAVAEHFLGSCLGGQVQPVGDDFKNSSIQVPHGLDYMPEVKTYLSELAN